jgi:hypothetical protein
MPALAIANTAIAVAVHVRCIDGSPLCRKRLQRPDHGGTAARVLTNGAIGPVLFGLADDPEAHFFYGQAASEVGVIAATDWNAA